MTRINADQPDPYANLEDVLGDEALDWVKARNAVATNELAETPGFTQSAQNLERIYASKEKLDMGVKRGDYVYNFHTDADHPRGIWRRTSFEDYFTPTPTWEILLDVDKLGADEDESWVWAGSRSLPPNHNRALISLSRGGSDANVVRELDLTTKQFVTDNAFMAEESKGSLSWIDEDTLLIGRDFGEGTLTASGYPLSARIWKRGEPMANAKEIFAGDYKDVAVFSYHDHTEGFERTMLERATDFRTSIVYHVNDDHSLNELHLPRTANVFPHREWALVHLRHDWEVDGTTVVAGSLVAVPFDDAEGNSVTADRISTIFTPTSSAALSDVTLTRGGVVVTMLDDVRCVVRFHRAPSAPGGNWVGSTLDFSAQGVDALDTVTVSAVDKDETDDLWLVSEGYLTPPTLWYAVVSPDGALGEVTKIRSTPAHFDATGLAVGQLFTESLDGTRIPYFIIGPEDAIRAAEAGDPVDQPRRTLQLGYGGFETGYLPAYSGGTGKEWLEKGNIFVVASIRGGGEYGPAWHQAALKDKRHKAYEDFDAIATDLVNRGLTTVSRLAARGRSNGGLLMGNMYTTYGDSFGAIVCQVPLLDMKRYTHLLAGASWEGEYGDPDVPEQWEYLQKYSSYHAFDPAKEFPPIIITTSTRDDRVHPGHARKFAALLEENGKQVTYYENLEGGHAGSADAKQTAFMEALVFEFLDRVLEANEGQN